jgi:hypothetical protein
MTLARRLYGALRLDDAAYEDVEADPTALVPAVAIVLAFGAAAAIGFSDRTPNLLALVGAAGAALVGWLSWAAIVAYLGVHVFPEPQTRADVGELARTLGFSAAPGLFMVLLAVPELRLAAFVAVSLWMLAAMVVAVRQALDFTGTGRAIGVCAAGWVLAGAFVLVAGFVFGSRLS